MATAKVPTIDELRAMYENGVPQVLLSGVEVVMRPLRPDALLMSGTIPDILTPLIMKMLFPAKKIEADSTIFPDEVDDPVTAYLTEEREKVENAKDFIKSIDVVCQASLVDASVLPYLSLPDRMWVFKLAFLPAEVLSTFRLQPQGDMEVVDDEQADAQQTEPDHAVGDVAERVEPVHSVPV